MLIYGKDEKLLLCHGLSHSEFRCRCKLKECRATLVNELLIRSYVRFRVSVDTMLAINSGYRCPRHNMKVGGVLKSRHMSGEAIDISYQSLKSKYIPEQVMDMLTSSGFSYVKFYSEFDFFHCDVRPVFNN